MNRIACLATMLCSPGLLLAAPAGPTSTSGLWKIVGDVMGTPVNIMCTITDTNHKLTGTCSGAADGYAPHVIAGSVKAKSVELHFDTAMQGNAITVIVSGTLNDDGTKMNGDLDVEPMGVGGAFAAERQSAPATPAPAAAPPATATTPPATPQVQAPAVDPAAVAGTWKVDGDVQGTPVKMTCILAVAADRTLSGTCSAGGADTGGGNDTAARKLAGAVTVKGPTWHFSTEYQDAAITVSMAGTLNADGTKMSGTMAVDPMGVDGTFFATRQ
jgi:hypothetical protein